MNVFFWDLFTWVALDVWLLSESLLLQFAACMCCVGCDVDRGQCRSVGSWRCCCWQLLWRSLQSDRRTASLTHWFVHLLAASLINSHSRPASLLFLLLLMSLDILVFVNIDYCWVCMYYSLSFTEHSSATNESWTLCNLQVPAFDYRCVQCIGMWSDLRFSECSARW